MIGSLSIRTPLAILVAAACTTGVALTVSDQARSIVDMTPVGVWFANDDADSVSHVGPAGADATVVIERVSGRLSVTELDGVAYVTDESGTLSRIDPARLVVSQQAELPTARTQLVGGGGRLYVVDRDAGTVRELEPTGLTTLAETTALGVRLGRAVVDDEGRLWVPDLATGEVLAIDGDRVVEQRRVGEPGDDLRLAVVDGVVVTVNPTAATVTEIAGEGSDGRRHRVEFGDGDLQLPTAVSDGSVLPVVEDGTLVTVDLRDGTTVRITLDADGHRLGAPVVARGLAYVPDFTAGALIVIDLARGELVDIIEVTGEPGRFDVAASADRVFVNDPDSEQAWTVGESGALVPMSKYDPSQPGGGTGGGTVPPPPGFDDEPEPGDETDDDADDETDADDGGADDADDSDDAADGDDATPSTTIAPGGEPVAPTTTTPPVVIVPPATPAPTTTVAQPPGNQGNGQGGSGNQGNPVNNGNGQGNSGDQGNNGNGQGNSGNTPPSATTTVPATTPTTVVATTVAPPPTTSTTTPPPTSPPVTVPPGTGAVLQLEADPTDGGAIVSWQPPANWFTVTGYVVTVEPSGGRHDVAASDTRWEVTGLANGDAYTFVVQAFAGDVAGLAMRSRAVVPTPDAPGPPAEVRVTAGPQRVDIDWDPPTSGRVTGYTVEVVPEDGSAVIVNQVAASPTDLAVTSLTNGVGYHAVVRATVDGVVGGATPSVSFVPKDVPTRPTSVRAFVTGPGVVMVTWTASSPNGSPLSGYRISAGGTDVATTDGNTTEVELDSLTVGQAYLFEVVATNGVGDSDAGAATSAIVVQSLVPDAPTRVDAVAGDRTVDITWDPAPANGSTIDSYLVRNLVDGTEHTVPASARSDTFGNLSNGTDYRFEVQAVTNTGATGQPKTSSSVRPAGALPDPSISSLVAVDPDSVTVTFATPSTSNGNTMQHWVVTIDTATPTTRTVTTGSVTFDNLRPGRTYTVTVTAHATNGRTSAASRSVSTPSGTPAPVTNLRVDWAFWQSAKASWTAVPGAAWYTFDPGDGRSPIQVTNPDVTWTPQTEGVNYVATVLAWTAWGSSTPVTVGYFVEPDPFDECGTDPQIMCP